MRRVRLGIIQKNYSISAKARALTQINGRQNATARSFPCGPLRLLVAERGTEPTTALKTKW